MANYEATRYDFDGANLTDVEGVNTGIIIPWSDTSVPSGFLECNGANVSRSTYAALFAIVGTTYGSGNGSTTFTLPDLQDDVVVGKSPTKALASTGGANTVTQSGNLAFSIGQTSLTTPEIPSHSHSGPQNSSDFQPNQNRTSATGNMGQGTGGVGNTPFTIENTGDGTGHSHPGSGNFVGDANSVLQPYLTVMYVIKT